MAYLPKSIYSNDFPQLEGINVASASGGTAADFLRNTICVLPDQRHVFLPKTLAENVQGNLKINRMINRMTGVVSQGTANTLGGTTNNCDVRLLVYRGGLLQGAIAYYPLSISTTIGTAIVAGNINTHVAVTPAAMTGIKPGLALIIDAGTATQEQIYVESTTSTTYTAYCTQLHTTGAAVQTGFIPLLATDILPCDALLANTTSTNAVGSAGSTLVGVTSPYGIHVNDYLVCDTAGSQETVQVAAIAMVDTTSGTAVGAPGAVAITPASMVGIVANAPLIIDTGGSVETVIVTSVTATTFTATFVNTHSSGFRIQSDYITATFVNTHSSGFTIAPASTSGILNVPALANGAPFEMRAGDVLVLARVSNNLTGLATPAFLFQTDWEPSNRYRQ